MSRLSRKQIFVEGEMVVFGYGGFYERPKGWGLDVCYLHKRDFAWWRSRRRLMRRIRQMLEEEVRSSRLMNGFVPQFLARLRRHVVHEWHYDRAELMFQAAKSYAPVLARFDDFPAFVRMVLAGRPFCTPEELETRVRDYLATILTEDEPLRRVESQNYLLFGFLQRTIEQDMCALLGQRHGEWLFKRLLEIAPEQPRNAPTLKAFLDSLLFHDRAMQMLADWHSQYFLRLIKRKEQTWRTLRRLRVAPSGNPLAGKAQRAVRRESTMLPPELVKLLEHLDVPVFVAVERDLSFFSAFHQPGYLVHQPSGTMHQMVGLGLCVQRHHARGAIFVTYHHDALPRFRHTLLEECTHFADGPRDRIHLRGEARYSGTPEFHAAFAADYARHNSWRSSRALGLREWGVILAQLRIPGRRISALQARIEAYTATMDFRHYAEEERMAELFAALPVIERAVGKKIARAALPEMFGYYESHYRKGLKQELREWR